jgi:hypothetical protein
LLRPSKFPIVIKFKEKLSQLFLPLEVVNEKHAEQNFLSDVCVRPNFVEEKKGNEEGRTFLEEPRQLSIQPAD